MNRRSRQSGYVLAMVLLLLVVAGTVLTGIARASLGRAVQAVRAQEDLQRRWAVKSCQDNFAGKIEELLGKAQESEESDKPVGSVPLRLVLGELDVDLLFSDEHAKVSANSLWARLGRSEVTERIKGLAEHADARVELRPSRDAEQVGFPVFSTLNQLFPYASASELCGDQSPSPAAYLRCWGEGKINFRRASDDAIEYVLTGVLTKPQIGSFLDARKAAAAGDKSKNGESKDDVKPHEAETSTEQPQPSETAGDEKKPTTKPAADLKGILDSLELPQARRGEAELLLTDKSTCHSLWIVTRSKERDWYRLVVVEQGQPALVFEW